MTEATLACSTGKPCKDKRRSWTRTDNLLQAQPLLRLPQRLPWLLWSIRHRRLRLHWNRAGRLGRRRDQEPREGDPESLETGRPAYLHLLHRQPLPYRIDCACEQRAVQRRWSYLALLAFRHRHSACRYQGPAVDLQRCDPDRSHECCQLLHVRFHSHYSGARCQRYVLGENDDLEASS